MKWGYEIAREEYSHETVSRNERGFGFEGRLAFQSLAAFAAELTVWNNLWITVRACQYQLRNELFMTGRHHHQEQNWKTQSKGCDAEGGTREQSGKLGIGYLIRRSGSSRDEC